MGENAGIFAVLSMENAGISNSQQSTVNNQRLTGENAGIFATLSMENAGISNSQQPTVNNQLSANDSHYFTVSDGIVYDSLTGAEGLQLEEYMVRYFQDLTAEGWSYEVFIVP